MLDSRIPVRWREEFRRFLRGEEVSAEFLAALESSPRMRAAAEDDLRNDPLMTELARTVRLPGEG
jgi:hypothetical protein